MCFQKGIARLLRQGDVQGAVRELGKAVPSHPERSLSHQNLLAICKAEMENLEESKALFHRILVQKPGDPRVLNNLGNVALLQGKPQEALRLYRRAAVLNPWAVEPRYNSCLAYLEMGHIEKALLAFQEYALLSKVLIWGKALFWGVLPVLIAVSICVRYLR